MNYLGGVLSGFLVGTALGAFGSGGSLLALPLLVGLAGLEPRAAVPASLASVGAIAAFGLLKKVSKSRQRNLLGTGIFALVSTLGTLSGVRINPYLPEEAILIIFGTLVLVVSVKMARTSGSNVSNRDQENARLNKPARRWLIFPLALPVGMLSGIFGVGGGFLIVPALVLTFNYSIAEAIPSSLMVITLNAFVGVAGYALQGNTFNPALIGVLFVGGAVGVIAGEKIISLTSSIGLRRAFVVFFLGTSIYLILRGLLML